MNLPARIVFILFMLAGSSSAWAQQINPTIPPPPPAPETPIQPPEAAGPPQATPVFDPLHAQRSMDIGTFYMNNGHYDAAIDRFQEAANYQPRLARPWRLLGEAYEKKHDSGKAVESYKKYLDIFPRAEDAAKVRKRIAALEEKGTTDPPSSPTAKQ